MSATGVAIRRPRLRMGERVFVWLALSGALVALLVIAGRWAVKMKNYQPDEFLSVIGARRFQEHFSTALTDTSFFSRGPERLTAIVLSGVNAVVPGTAAEMQAGHIVLLACFLLTPVIAYFIARELGAGRWVAAGSSLLTVCGPWLVLGTSYMSVTLAVPLTAVLVLVTWRAFLAPSPGRDILVLLVAAVTVVARTGTLPLLAAIALTAIVMSWRSLPTPRGPVDLVRAVIRRHPVLVAAGALALVVIVIEGAESVVGVAYNSTLQGPPTPGYFFGKVSLLFAELGAGTGYLPMVIGLPWVVHEAWRPRRPETGAFAVLALAFFAVFTYTTASAGATPEERYIAVLSFLPVVAFAAAVSRREVSVIGSLITVVLLARAVATSRGEVDPSAYGYFSAPARRFLVDVLGGHLSGVLSGTAAQMVTPLMLGLIAATALFLFAFRRWPAPTTGVALVAMLAVGLVAGEWSTRKFVGTAGAPNERWADVTWIDHVTHGRPAGYFTDRPTDPVFRTLLLRAVFFNASMSVPLEPPKVITRDSGAFDDSDTPYLVTFAGYRSIVPAGHELKRSQILGNPTPLRVDALDRPAHALLRIATLDSGSVRAARPALVNVYRGARGRCASVPLVSTRRTRVRLRTGEQAPTVVLPAGRYRTTIVPLRDTRALWIEPLDRRTTVAIGELTVRDC